MAITVSDFLVAFPEFADAPATLLAAKLAEAQLMVPDVVWGGGTPSPGGGGGSLTQRGTFLYCAHFLALNPYARKMALVHKDGKTTLYSQQLDQLKRIVSSGFRSL